MTRSQSRECERCGGYLSALGKESRREATQTRNHFTTDTANPLSREGMSDFSEETGFDGYEPESVNPGPSVLIATIVFCILSIAIIPCLISLHKHCERRRGGNDESSRGNERTQTANENESPQKRAQERVSGCSKICHKETTEETSTAGSFLTFSICT